MRRLIAVVALCVAAAFSLYPALAGSLSLMGVGKPAAAAPAFDLTYQTKAALNNGSATQNYGTLSWTAGATRMIAVIMWYPSSNSDTISSVTINSQTFSQISGARTHPTSAIIIDQWISDGPVSGTSGNATVILSAATTYVSGIGLFNLTTGTTAPGTAGTGAADAATTASCSSINVPAGGRATVGSFAVNGSSLTPSGWTSDALDTTGGVDMTWGHTTTTGAQTPTTNTSGTEAIVISCVPWSP